MNTRQKIRFAIQVLTEALKETGSKVENAQADADEFVSPFVDQNLRPCPGGRIPFRDVFDKFTSTLPVSDRPDWSKRRFSRALRTRVEVANKLRNQVYACEVAWSEGQ